MEVTNTFLPTAGVVGLLPMVTYFFLVVAMFVFLGNFIFALATQSAVRPAYRTAHTLTACVALLAVLSYYLLQADYRILLTELVTLTDAGDRQTLIREAYNAMGHYRYMNWAIVAPLLLIQAILRLNLRTREVKRSLALLLTAAFLLFFTSYLGHQQLSFDNEILAGPKAIWGVVAASLFGFIFFTLQRLGRQSNEPVAAGQQTTYSSIVRLLGGVWGVYLIGYFLTLTPIDFNWLHLLFTLADLAGIVGIGLTVYVASLDVSKPE
ncbi:bacteriorhodopsin [Spirosoma koreense]